MRKLSALLFVFVALTLFVVGNSSQAAPTVPQPAGGLYRGLPTRTPTSPPGPPAATPTATPAVGGPTPTSPPNPTGPIVWGPNQKANTDAETCNSTNTNCAHHEPEIAVNPHNDMNAVVAFKDWRDGKKQVYLGATFDGGKTWSNQLAPGVRDLQIADESDPVVVFGADGVAYASLLAYNGADEGTYVTRSSDGGATWSRVVAAWRGGKGSSDKDWMAIDTNPASPYYNRLYVTWSNEYVVRYFGAYSTNGGASWSIPTQLGNNETLVSIPVVLPNGNVLVTMYGDGTTAITEVKSTDGGVSWSAEKPIADLAEVNCGTGCDRGNSVENWRTITMQAVAVDKHNGNVYMVWEDSRNDATNGYDIYYSRSTDSGDTWSSPIRLNDDPAGRRIDQTEPTIAVAPDGTVYVAWMDKRDDPSNLLLNLYYTSSSDGGKTWLPDTRLSTASSDYNVGIAADAGNAAGDYMGISAAGNAVWIVWTDTRNQREDIYTIRGTRSASPPPAVTPTPAPVATPAATPPPQTASTDNPYKFDVTGKTIGGKFRAYWESHGGLAQQGYPITDEFQEVSLLDGKTYTVQYFERAVFELHPENAGTPYEVELSQLGAFRYHAKYPDGAPNQTVSTDNPLYFQTTRHTIGGKFRAYWESHGGLAQQGYPISDEFQEVSPIDGKTYTVQYFERAVFELHPENAGTPYEVELSQLGTFQYQQKYQAGP